MAKINNSHDDNYMFQQILDVCAALVLSCQAGLFGMIGSCLFVHGCKSKD